MPIDGTRNQTFAEQGHDITPLGLQDPLSTANNYYLGLSKSSNLSATPSATSASTLTTSPSTSSIPAAAPSATNVNPTALDWVSKNIVDSGLKQTVLRLDSDGILDRNDMLAIFTTGLTDDNKIDPTEQTDLKNLLSNANLFSMPDYVKYLTTKVVNGISSNMSISDFDSKLVNPWFLGSAPPTASFNGIALTYKPVNGTLFGSSGTAKIGDIDQGYFGDCAFLSALGATFSPQLNSAGNQSSSIIQSMIINNGDNTYTIRFYDNSNPEWVTVNNLLPFNATTGQWFGATAAGSTDPNNSANVLWAPLAERAYAQWREWRDGSNGYNLIGNGDDPYRPLSFVTGKPATQFGQTGTGSSFTSVTFSYIQSALNNHTAVELGRYNPSDTTYILGSHAYAVTNAYVNQYGEQRIVVYNPWGYDGLTVQGNDDGFIDLSFTQFQLDFDAIAFA